MLSIRKSSIIYFLSDKSWKSESTSTDDSSNSDTDGSSTDGSYYTDASEPSWYIENFYPFGKLFYNRK